MIVVESDRFAFINNVDSLPNTLATRIQVKEVLYKAAVTSTEFLALRGSWFISIISEAVNYRGDHTLRGDIYLSGSDVIINYLPDTNLRPGEIGFKIHVLGSYTGCPISALDKLVPTNRRSTHFLESIGALPISQIRLPGTTISTVADVDVLGISADYLAVYDMVPYLAINPKSSKGYSLYFDPAKLDYFVNENGVPVSFSPSMEGVERTGNLDRSNYEDTILQSFRTGWDVNTEPPMQGCIRYRSISAFAEQEIMNALRNFRTIDESSFVMFKNYDIPVSNAFKREAVLRGLKSSDYLTDPSEDEVSSLKSVLTSYESLIKVLSAPINSESTLHSIFADYDVLVETDKGLDQLLTDFNTVYSDAKVEAVRGIASSYLFRLENMSKAGGEFYSLNRKVTPDTITDSITSWLTNQSVISYLIKRFGFVSYSASNINAFCSRVNSYFERIEISYNDTSFVFKLDGATVSTPAQYYALTDEIEQASLNSLEMPIKLPIVDPDYLELKGMNINSGTKAAALELCKNLVRKYGLDTMPVSELNFYDPSQIFRVSNSEGGLGDLVNSKFKDVVTQIQGRLTKIPIIEGTTTMTSTDFNEASGTAPLPTRISYKVKPTFFEYDVEQPVFEHHNPQPFLCETVGLDMISKTQARIWMDFSFLPFLGICPDLAKVGKLPDDYRAILKKFGIDFLSDIFNTKTDSSTDVKFLYVDSGYSTQLGRMRMAIGATDAFMRTRSFETTHGLSSYDLYAGRLPMTPTKGWFGRTKARSVRAEDPYILRVSKVFDVVAAEFTAVTSGTAFDVAEALGNKVEQVASAAAIQAVIENMESYSLTVDDKLAGEIDQALILLDDLTRFAYVSTEYVEAVDALFDTLAASGADVELVMTIRNQLAKAKTNMGEPVYYLGYTDASVATNGRMEPNSIGHYLFGRQ